MGLQGDVRSLRSLRKALAKLPTTSAARIAARGAPGVSTLARDAYDSGRTVYGSARPKGVDGQELSLVRTGASRHAVRFEAEGTRMRTAVLPRWTRYLIGRYDVLPNGPLPPAWRAFLDEVAARVLHARIFGYEP